jgi:long-chain acyl-CoA synthetase
LVAQRRVATRLRDGGIGAGDRVAVLGGNRPAFLDAVLGCLRSGVIPVPMDVHLPGPALQQRLDDADPALVLADAEFEDLARASGRAVQVMDAGWPHRGAEAEIAPWPLTRAMHYTSGTTGRSKGVHAGVLGSDGGRAIAEEEQQIWGFTPDDVHLVCGPLYHSGPLRFAVNTLLYGGTVVLLDRFTGAGAARAVAEHGVTTTFMVPIHLSRLLADPAATPAALHSVRLVAHAGAPCPTALKLRALEQFPAGSVHEFYGATEGQFTAIGPAQWATHPGSVGQARAGRVLSIRRDDGSPAPTGEVGTVYTSAPPFARFEYWRDPERTAQVWDGNWFTVQDLGRLDEEGFLYLAGRSGDLIISGGVNVYPAEVERELLAHPDVEEAVVFGAPDPDWGERVCAAVVAVPGARLEPAQLTAWVRPRLSAAQRPKALFVVDDLPRTGSGKVRRSELAAALVPPPA